MTQAIENAQNNPERYRNSLGVMGNCVNYDNACVYAINAI